MLQGVNVNFVIILLVSGAVLLAAIYHTILFVHRGGQLLSSYSIYLWSTFSYCLFRVAINSDDPNLYRYLNPDEMLQMISFIMYVRFAAIAMDLDRIRDKYPFLFAKMTPYVIGGYLLLNTALINTGHDGDYWYFIFKITARAYLLILGFLLLLIVLRRRKLGFYKYLGAGAISMIIFGLISSLMNLFEQGKFILGAISWLMFGFFTDVIFFSAAIGYRIRQEYNERERSLKAIIEKDAEIKKREMEKIKVIYETREQERSRIAQDLHDEIGATLSGIALHSHLASKQIKENKTDSVLNSLDLITTGAVEMVNNINEVVWTVNPKYDNVEQMLERLKEYAFSMAQTKNILVQLEVTENIKDIKLTMESRRNIYLIMKEAINNAVKYAECNRINIKASYHEQIFILMISDNGKGFDLQHAENGNGLKNMKSRAEESELLLNFESRENNGTTITIKYQITQ
jgi:signal transduction histidine kinase